MATIPVVNDKDKRWGVIASILTMLILATYLYLFNFQFADPPPVDIPLQAEAEFDEMVLEDLKIEAGGAGGGQPSQDPVADPKPEVTDVITAPNPETQVTTGKSNKTNTTKPSTNTPTTTATGNNPFGGNGGGTGGGNGSTFGTDTGKEGSGGTGTGSGAGRVRKNEISTDNIFVTSYVKVQLLLTINDKGQVVAAQCITAGTTTTDQRIISQVMAAAKSQLSYNEEPGAGLQKVYYTVGITAN